MATLEKYIKVITEKEKTADNEIRISGRGSPSSYIAYAARLLLENENKCKEVILKASGPTISKACTVAEILRQRIKGLAQISSINSKKIEDVYDPIEEGLDTVRVQRFLTVFEVQLSTDNNLDTNNIGYQEPLPEDQIKEFPHNFGGGGYGGRGNYRGGGGYQRSGRYGGGYGSRYENRRGRRGGSRFYRGGRGSYYPRYNRDEQEDESYQRPKRQDYEREDRSYRDRQQEGENYQRRPRGRGGRRRGGWRGRGGYGDEHYNNN